MNGKVSIINKNNTYCKYRINKYLQLRYSRVERLKNNYIYGSKFGELGKILLIEEEIEYF